MKKVLVLVLSLAITISLIACGASPTTSENTPESGNIDYPTGNIRLVVPFAAGGGTDIAARIWAEALTKELGVSVYVEDLEGGSGIVGATEVVHSDPDGSDILFTQFGPIITQVLRGNTEYATEDLKCISSASAVPLTMVVPADSKINTIEELVQYATANPGEFKYGTPGSGTAAHIACENFASKANITLKAVTYDGTSTAVAATLGGDVMACVAPLNDILNYVTSGQMKILYSTMADEALPDAPLLKDAGYDVTAATYTAFFVPKDTPAEIVAILESAIKNASEDETLLEAYKNQGAVPYVIDSSDMTDVINSEKAVTEQVLKDLGII